MWLEIGCCVVLLFLTRLLWQRWRYDVHKIPSPPGLPLLGHTLDFMFGKANKQILQWAGEQFKRLGNPKLVRMHFMGRTIIAVTDMKLIRQVILSPTDSFLRYMQSKRIGIPMLGNDLKAESLFMSPTPTPYAKAVRKIYLTASQSNNLKVTLPKMRTVLRIMLEKMESLRQEGSVDVQDLFVKMTLDAIGVTAFGKDFGSLSGKQDLHHLMRRVSRIGRERTLNPIWGLYSSIFKNTEPVASENAAVDRLTSIWTELAQEILDREDPIDGSEPIWYGLKHMKHPETGKRIEFKTLVTEVALVVLAGSDTTGLQLAWTAALLATNKQVEAKLIKELSDHHFIGENARDVEYEDLAELPYLTAIIKESMRIAHISSSLSIRQMPRDMDVLGYRLPKGTLFFLLGNRAVMRATEWGDPEVFRPERWLTGEDFSNYYNLGFSVGPRDCVGQRLAMMEMRVALIEFVRAYEFTLEGSYEELCARTYDALLVEVKGGIRLHLKPRTQI